MRHDSIPSDGIQELDPGLNVIDVPSHRSGAVHQVALNAAVGTEGETVWVDARNNAISQLLRHPGTRRHFADIRLARAFTAYQHHELIRTLPGELAPDTPLIVAPCITSLYQDDDVPGSPRILSD